MEQLSGSCNTIWSWNAQQDPTIEQHFPLCSISDRHDVPYADHADLFDVFLRPSSHVLVHNNGTSTSTSAAMEFNSKGSTPESLPPAENLMTTSRDFRPQRSNNVRAENATDAGNSSSGGSTDASASAMSNKEYYRPYSNEGVRQQTRLKRPRSDTTTSAAASPNERAAKEMVYWAAAMRPVSMTAGAEEAEQQRPQRRNVRISSDPQTMAARIRRERVSERLRALRTLVPGGSKMDTAAMLDEAASYLRFLKAQVSALGEADKRRRRGLVLQSAAGHCSPSSGRLLLPKPNPSY